MQLCCIDVVLIKFFHLENLELCFQELVYGVCVYIYIYIDKYASLAQLVVISYYPQSKLRLTMHTCMPLLGLVSKRCRIHICSSSIPYSTTQEP